MRRYARTHGPFETRALRERYGLDLTPVLERLEQAGDLVRGELRPGGTQREWCDPEVLRRLRRASLAALRAEIEPADQRAFARFQASWQGVDRHPPGGAGPDRLREVLVPLQGLALPLEVWERDVLPRRTGAYSPAWMDQLCASGEVVWVGAGALGRRSGRVALYFRDDAPLIGPPPKAGEPPEEPVHEAVRERLRAGPCFFTDLLTDVAGFTTEELQNALWDLVWAGEATNDAFAPLRSPKLTATPSWSQRARAERRRTFGIAPPQRRAARGPGPLVAHRRAVRHGPTIRPPAAARRPSCCSSATGSSPASRCWPRASRAASASLYDSLAALETIGIARRGYFVEGLGGAQFALPGAVERLRAQKDDDAAPPIVLAATDPAQPYGAVLKWPETERRPARQAGAYVVLAGAEPVLFVERGGKGLQVLVDARRPARSSRRWPRSPTPSSAAGSSGSRSSASTASRSSARPTRSRCSSSASAPARASSRSPPDRGEPRAQLRAARRVERLDPRDPAHHVGGVEVAGPVVGGAVEDRLEPVVLGARDVRAHVDDDARHGLARAAPHHAGLGAR